MMVETKRLQRAFVDLQKSVLDAWDNYAAGFDSKEYSAGPHQFKMPDLRVIGMGDDHVIVSECMDHGWIVPYKQRAFVDLYQARPDQIGDPPVPISSPPLTDPASAKLAQRAFVDLAKSIEFAPPEDWQAFKLGLPNAVVVAVLARAQRAFVDL